MLLSIDLPPEALRNLILQILDRTCNLPPGLVSEAGIADQIFVELLGPDGVIKQRSSSIPGYYDGASNE